MDTKDIFSTALTEQLETMLKNHFDGKITQIGIWYKQSDNYPPTLVTTNWLPVLLTALLVDIKDEKTTKI